MLSAAPAGVSAGRPMPDGPLGPPARRAANLIYALAALMVVLSVAGFVHALYTPKDEFVLGLAPERATAATS